MGTIEKFLKEGKLLSPKLWKRVEDLSEEQIQKLLKTNSLVLSEKNLRRLQIPEPNVLKKKKQEKKDVHVSDFTQFYLERFNFLKKEIQKKLNPDEISSINKLSSGEASVIGMLREIENGKVILEDNTGRVLLKTDEKFLEDEVVGAKGKVIVDEGAQMQPRKIFYPDVPLRREVSRATKDLNALFISSINKKMIKIIEDLEPDYVFFSEELKEAPEISLPVPVVGISDQQIQKESFKTDKDPVRVDVANLKILLHTGAAVNKAREKLDVKQTKALISLLQKRHLNPTEMHSLEDRYLIREVPDIIHVHGEEAMANYKGVTLLSTSPEKGYLVNLKTREVEEVDV